jgi:hypothetical protein
MMVVCQDDVFEYAQLDFHAVWPDMNTKDTDVKVLFHHTPPTDACLMYSSNDTACHSLDNCKD